MANKSITIEVSESVHETLQAAAEASARSAEHFSLDDLRPLFEIAANANVDALMESMGNYTDSQLWIVVGRRDDLTGCQAAPPAGITARRPI
ncbi:MAG: hypothetical protein SGI73_13660 [Chloroflexota bacterium]|nr:hypothetical protein [Chloroflexota bacterium]